MRGREPRFEGAVARLLLNSMAFHIKKIQSLKFLPIITDQDIVSADGTGRWTAIINPAVSKYQPYDCRLFSFTGGCTSNAPEVADPDLGGHWAIRRLRLSMRRCGVQGGGCHGQCDLDCYK